jgi:hypothetical protein
MNEPLKFQRSDGGQAACRGYFTDERDCVPRAIAIATGVPYKEVWEALAKIQTRSPSTGTYPWAYEKYLLSIGWKKLPVKTWARLDKRTFPGDGAYLASTPRHLVAVVNQTVLDTWDSRRKRVKAIFVKQAESAVAKTKIKYFDY